MTRASPRFDTSEPGFDIDIRLDQPDGALGGGEAVTGRIIVTGNRFLEAGIVTRLKVEVGLRYFIRRRMKGYDETNPDPSAESRFQGAAFWTTIEADAPAPTAGESRAFPFRIGVPEGAFSFEGELIRLRWVVLCRATWGALKRVTCEHPIVVVPGEEAGGLDAAAVDLSAGARERLREYRARRRNARRGRVAEGLWYAAAVAIGLFATVPVMNMTGYQGWLLLLLPMAAALGMRELLGIDTIGGERIVVDTSPERPRPGDTVTVHVRFRPRRAFRHGAVRATVEAIERVRIDEDLSSHDKRFRQFIELEPPGSYPGGRPVEYEFQVELPADVPPTLDVDDGSVFWQVRVEVPRPRGLDKEVQQEFLVCALPGRSLADRQARPSTSERLPGDEKSMTRLKILPCGRAPYTDPLTQE